MLGIVRDVEIASEGMSGPAVPVAFPLVTPPRVKVMLSPWYKRKKRQVSHPNGEDVCEWLADRKESHCGDELECDCCQGLG